MRWSKTGSILFAVLLANMIAGAARSLAQNNGPAPTNSAVQTNRPEKPYVIPPVPNPNLPAVAGKPQAAIAPPVQLRFVVVLDPSHGGQDPGAKLGGTTLEKDIVLSISTRLRTLLNERGIPVVLTRDTDNSETADERAAIGNHARAAACISLHATATGSGVHLFTSSLPATNYQHEQFIPWNAAQGAVSTQSVRLASEINTALGAAKLPVLLGRTALRPLDSFTCPALAIELAPLAAADGAASLSDPKYQQRVAEALASALAAWRVDWRQRP